MTTATSHPALSLQLAELERKATLFEMLAKSALPPHLPTSSDLEALDAARADFKDWAARTNKHPETITHLMGGEYQQKLSDEIREFLQESKP